MSGKAIKYNTGFSTGSLLFKESDAVISQIQNAKSFMKDDEILPFKLIPVNSESSQKRLYREVTNRLKALENPRFIELYQKSILKDKLLILFYAACKRYGLIADFMLDTVLSKWYNMDREITSYDFQSFLYKQTDSHPELESLSPYSSKKLGQVVMRMLLELGLQKNGMLHKSSFGIEILKEIVLNGDGWFLQTLFLNEEEQNAIKDL